MKKSIATLTVQRQNCYYLFYMIEQLLNYERKFKLDLLTFKEFNEQYQFGDRDAITYMQENVSPNALCIMSFSETGSIQMLGFDYTIYDLVLCVIGNPRLRPILKPIAKRINPEEYEELWKNEFEEEKVE